MSMTFEHMAAWEICAPSSQTLTEENESLRATIATLTAELAAAKTSENVYREAVSRTSNAASSFQMSVTQHWRTRRS